MPDVIRFAVAIPIGQWHDFIPAAFESLASQGVPMDIALLDASEDPRVAEAADASGLAFTYRRHGPDGGQSDAIREGWANTGGDVVFWLNGDDRLLPSALEAVTRAFQSKAQPDVVFGGSDFIDGEARTIGQHDQVAEASPLLLRSNVISQPSCFVRRTAMEAVGGVDRDLHFVMDWDLWVKLYKSGYSFLRIEQALSAVFIGEGTKTEQVSARRLGEVFALVHRNAGLWAATKSALSLWAHTLKTRRSDA
jgi:glycosyltransferase involved in cell wall biosynthesis